MAFTDKYGITNIKDGEREVFSISWDYDTDLNDVSQRTAVLLLVPDKSKTDHHHIVLEDKEAKLLRDWLDSYLSMKEERARKS